MKVFFGSDHAGFELKAKLIGYVESLGHEVEDLGPHKLDEQDDYPDFIFPVARAVAADLDNCRGVILGGGGQGEAMVANRVKGVHAAVYYGPRPALAEAHQSGANDDVIRLAREHNSANILSLAARFLSEEEAREAIGRFLSVKFSHAERHERRIVKLDN